MTRRLILLATLFCATFPFAASAQRCNCGADQQSGTIVCQADCTYPSSCVGNSNIVEYNYCYRDAIAGVCFNGGYDPCCDPTCYGF